MTAPTAAALLALAERAVVALERIAAALNRAGVPHIPDEVLVADVEAGLSLRRCAAKHNVGVGRVRGAIARAQAAMIGGGR